MSSVPPPPPPPTSDPYKPPQPHSPIPSAVSDSRIAAEVSAPATGLLVTAILGGVIQLLGLFVNMLGAGLGSLTAEGSEQQIINWLSGGLGVASAAVALLIAGLIIYASMEMKKLRQWGLAVAASILAMVPCISPCCIIGLPMGIWSLVILMRDDVKSAFK
jgi:hypothetical protein